MKKRWLLVLTGALCSASTGVAQESVLIDPAHGGLQTGAVSTYGHTERDVTLQVAKRLQTSLEASGVAATLTRAGVERGLADDLLSAASPETIIVSIHTSGYQQETRKGGRIHFCSKMSDGHKLGLLLANTLSGSLVEYELIPATGLQEVALCRGTVGSAVSIGIGALTNPEEARLILTKAFQSDIVSRITAALVKFQESS